MNKIVSYKVVRGFIKGKGEDYEAEDLGEIYHKGRPKYKVVHGKHVLTSESDFKMFDEYAHTDEEKKYLEDNVISNPLTQYEIEELRKLIKK